MRWSDWLLLACAGVLVVVGPAMAIQELAKAQEEKARFDLTGELTPVDASLRDGWRLPLTALVLVTGLVATFTLVRAVLDVGTRPLVGRLVALMLGGLALLYVTYYVDGAFFATQPYALRGTTIVWLYPVAGVLVGGSAWRLGEIATHFGARRAGKGDVVL